MFKRADLRLSRLTGDATVSSGRGIGRRLAHVRCREPRRVRESWRRTAACVISRPVCCSGPCRCEPPHYPRYPCAPCLCPRMSVRTVHTQVSACRALLKLAQQPAHRDAILARPERRISFRRTMRHGERRGHRRIPDTVTSERSRRDTSFGSFRSVQAVDTRRRHAPRTVKKDPHSARCRGRAAPSDQGGIGDADGYGRRRRGRGAGAAAAEGDSRVLLVGAGRAHSG